MKVYVVVQRLSLIGMRIDKIFSTKQDAENYLDHFELYCDRESRCIQEWKVENFQKLLDK
jgi:hypothetical protein